MNRLESTQPIICAVEDTDVSRHGAAASKWLAGAFGAPLLLVHVFDPDAIPVLPQREMDAASLTDDYLERAARQRAHRLVEEIAHDLGGPIGTEVPEGMPLPTLLQLGDALRPRLFVSGTSAREGLDGVLIESVSRQLADRAPCPVAVVPPGATLEGPGPVVAGYDGSEHSRRAARHAAALAGRLDRELVLVHATGGPEELVTADAAIGVDAKLDVVEGDPAETLARLGREREAPFVVTGTRGRNVVTSALLGSVTDGLVRRADRPVVLVPANAGDAP
jgi:nucleotide-binding universal stress UspA family protein